MPTLVSFPLLLLRSPYQSQICTSRESMRQTNRLSVSFQSPLVLLNSPPIRSPLNARKVKSIDLILSNQSDNTLLNHPPCLEEANRISQTSRRKSVQTREAETRFVLCCCYCLYYHHPRFCSCYYYYRYPWMFPRLRHPSSFSKHPFRPRF